ncbi:MAG TPA: response regulator transcription factor [Bacteroidia bacterium]|nr:response regulator transcription factor [Bacteroidia bacterium]
MKKPGVLIVEDHENIRDGLMYMINSAENLNCLGAVSSGEAALKFVEQHKPDIVLMDINLPGMSGIECTKIIKAAHPDILVMMCTVYEDDEKIFKALSVGASGYILKKSSSDELLDAINQLMNGGAPMSSQIARKVVNYFHSTTATMNDSEGITEREVEILTLLANGFRNKEIADKLFISLHTVKSHIYNIYQKLHVQSRIEAVNKFRGMNNVNLL